MMKLVFIAVALLASGVTAIADSKNDPVCGPSSQIEDTFNQKGFRHLLDMKNDHDVIQSLWLNSQTIFVTAQKDEKTSCLIATFKGVTLNPITIELIYDQLKKSRKEI